MKRKMGIRVEGLSLRRYLRFRERDTVLYCTVGKNMSQVPPYCTVALSSISHLRQTPCLALPNCFVVPVDS